MNFSHSRVFERYLKPIRRSKLNIILEIGNYARSSRARGDLLLNKPNYSVRSIEFRGHEAEFLRCGLCEADYFVENSVAGNAHWLGERRLTAFSGLVVGNIDNMATYGSTACAPGKSLAWQ